MHILSGRILFSPTFLTVALDQFVETVKQLVQDVEERLVFRANIFFQHDLLKYNPSPGDLAYPEKLEQMEVGQNPILISNFPKQLFLEYSRRNQ